MGDMADFELESVVTMEGLRDNYVSGDMDMHEAYEHGFLDEMGIEQEGIQAAWDRSEIPTIDNLNNQLSHAVKDIELSTLRKQLSQPCSNPICSMCHKEMGERHGKYGKFYYCGCSGQKCISAKNWGS